MKGIILDTFIVKKARIRQVVLYENQNIDSKNLPWASTGITVHKNGFWTGTIAYEGKKTVDGRLIADNALWWKEEEEIPLALLREPLIYASKTPPADPIAIIGVVHEFTRREYGAIRANGTCEGMAPGNYFCGFDVDSKDEDTELQEDNAEIHKESEESP